MGDRGHNRHGPKRGVGLLCVFRGAELGTHLTQCGLGRGLLPYQVVHLHPSSRLATIDMDRKLVVCPFGEGGAGSPSNNVARAEAYLHAKFHLIRPTVWPQYTNVTDRQDSTDRTTGR